VIHVPPPANSDALVVKPTSSGRELSADLRAFGAVEKIEPGGLLVVRPRETELEAVRQQILETVRGVAWVEPALVDEGREPSLPTGEVSVRFSEPLSPKALKRFASDHGLRVHRLNEFVPEQITFRPIGLRNTSLSQIVSSVQKEPNVTRAWPNTMSRYRREG
jgi:hypothetical protein